MQREIRDFIELSIPATFDRLALHWMIRPPVTVTNRQLIAIGRKYLQDKQVQEHRLASEHMRTAIEAAMMRRSLPNINPAPSRALQMA